MDPAPARDAGFSRSGALDAGYGNHDHGECEQCLQPDESGCMPLPFCVYATLCKRAGAAHLTWQDGEPNQQCDADENKLRGRDS